MQGQEDKGALVPSVTCSALHILVFCNFMYCLSRQSWRLSSLRGGVEVGRWIVEMHPRQLQAWALLVSACLDDSVIVTTGMTGSTLRFRECTMFRENSGQRLELAFGQCHPIKLCLSFI